MRTRLARHRRFLQSGVVFHANVMMMAEAAYDDRELRTIAHNDERVTQLKSRGNEFNPNLYSHGFGGFAQSQTLLQAAFHSPT